MTDSPSTDWYVKTDGDPEGPVTLATLEHWAATGGIDGSAELANAPEGPWSPASDLGELELDWQVKDEQGAALPPCHILALRSRVEDETVQPYWDVVHLPTGEVYDVVDALCSALLAQNHILEEKLAKALHAPEKEVPEGSPRDLRMKADAAEREAVKWRHLYEGEVERNETRERELQERIEELRGWQRKASERIKALERRRGQLEELVVAARPGETGDGDTDVLRGYQELQIQFEHLMESLNLRNQQLDRTREELHETQLELSKERQRNRELTGEADSLHQETLDQLTRLEQAHADLTRSYRDLNDRAVRLSNRDAAAPSRPPETPAEPPPSSASPSPATPGGGPGKLNMT